MIKTLPIYLSDEEKTYFRKQINIKYLGNENCNYWDDETSSIVPVKPNMESEEFKQKHYEINAVHSVNVKVEMDENCNFVFNLVK